jgi:outer membrane lipoprotein SlyB
MSSKAERIACAAAGVAAGTLVAGPSGAVAGAAVVDRVIQKLEKRNEKKK